MMLRTARVVHENCIGSVEVYLGVAKGYGPEQLINSRSGRIHLFPAVPEKATVAFREMQARGGFAVSAECVRGRATYVEIKARRDGVCRLMNPWPGKPVTIRETGTGAAVSCKIDPRHPAPSVPRTSLPPCEYWYAQYRR